ncbi:hypothetical protein SAMN02745244_00112 [Tessaracoccus bendigoensis DSM 12906]|uniref:Uncharacterized protein n=1 Tax=Tessaracoccus bendigoensis DSM 12906 TaxID=1123357 RepID=A0A1M6A5Q5_9ACTN|nr:hypothetical protein SAMN02745244_00112 [Tessaracoccus bendigoensis DSM 12906]
MVSFDTYALLPESLLEIYAAAAGTPASMPTLLNNIVKFS